METDGKKGAIAMIQIATALKTIVFWLPAKVSPKARPRVSNGQAYLPSFYREWKRSAVLEILCQLSEHASLPLARANVEIALTGKHRGDLDNLAGGILDALVEAQVITDDRLSCVPKLVVTHTLNGECGATIVITEL